MLELLHIGHSKKPKGVKGHLRLHIEDKYIESLGEARALFFDLDGSKVPFLIEGITMSNQLLVKLDEIDNPEEAQLLVSRSIFLDTKEVLINPEEESESKVFDHLIGFTVKNEAGDSYGIIRSIEEYPSQMMALIDYKEKSYLWPLHDDNIIEVSANERTLVLSLPDGVEDLAS